jgi:predicted ribosomally synthesized peptide with nif11-like leader
MIITLIFFGGAEMPIDKIELTKEQVAKAMACKTAEELMAMAKAEGIELTKEEAEAYLAEMDDVELDSDTLKQVAGGGMSYCSDLFTFKKAPEGCPNLEASR